jgi:hypothetical protein
MLRAKPRIEPQAISVILTAPQAGEYVLCGVTS